MQRRAIRDAKTPEKMKQAKPVVDDSLTLQGKKDKIKSNLQRLAELGKVDPQNRYQDLINDIAKVIINLTFCWCFILLSTKYEYFHQLSPTESVLHTRHFVFASCRTSETKDGTASAGKPSWCDCNRQTPPLTRRRHSSTIRSTHITSTSRPAWTTWQARASKWLGSLQCQTQPLKMHVGVVGLLLLI